MDASTPDVPLLTSLFTVQTAWLMGDPEMAALCHVPAETYLEWKKQADQPTEATIPPGMQSAAHVVALHQKLSWKYPEIKDQVEWLTTPNPHFDENNPLDIALSSPENLLWVNYYLESRQAFGG